ncbi:MAG TPA: DUF4347 domain-containing protein, partial [Noviherbaspirillum sp.]|uniref:DUF4347 domain-containing protein n=1 Tax=Noviherbaspirillum sp. TaxID=1926288 RepID=UPI002D2F6E78
MENPQVVAGAASREIVFVENNIDDWQALVDALVPGTEVVVLDSRSNGLQQMADHLAGRSGIDAIHVFSHGAGGRIDLGASALSAATLAPNAGLLGDIGRALGDGGDFLVYGCELAKDDAGRALIASVARLLQADVAASVDATTPGSLALEYATGSISADPAQLFDSAKLAAGKWVLSAPAIANLDGESVALAAAGSSVKLDAGTALAISDAEFSGDWDGATLTVQRSGTAIGNDVFGFDTSANPGFTVGAGVLQAGGQTFATFTNSGGVLSIDFSGSGTTATKALVEKVMQNVTYRNDTPYGDATIRFALSDGTDTATADVTVTSSRIYVDQSAYDTDGDIADGFNLAEALAAAGDGDTILIKDGSYRGQFVATKAVTIDAANGAAGNVILESPDRADLQFSSRQTIHGRERIPILDLRTSTAGQGTVTVKNLTVDGRNQAPSDTQYPTITVPRTNGLMHQIGIATFDTNALIDNVKVKNISTTVDPVSGDYSGLSENFGMLAEGRAELAAKVSVTIRNSTITTFQKAGINAWGPKLDVNILDNTITGVGVHGTSNQNGIQIGSLSPRTGTTGVVSGNTISGLDTNDNNW